MKFIRPQKRYYERKTVGRLRYAFIFSLMIVSGFYNAYFMIESKVGEVLGTSTTTVVETVEVPVEVEKVLLEPMLVEAETDKQQYMIWAIEIFGDKADEAIKIMACESGFNPNTVGDTYLMSHNKQTGEWIGDSIGLFQVRSGSTDWNRAAANNMTADEFRAWMKDPKANIEYAKTIYDRAGQSWKPWFNCMNKNGLK